MSNKFYVVSIQLHLICSFVIFLNEFNFQMLQLIFAKAKE
jgi:hypothetical protein